MQRAVTKRDKWTTLLPQILNFLKQSVFISESPLVTDIQLEFNK